MENKKWSRILIIIWNSVMESWSALLPKSEFLFLMLSSDLDGINLLIANQAKRTILCFHLKWFFLKSDISFKIIIATPVLCEPLALPEVIISLQEQLAFTACSKILKSMSGCWGCHGCCCWWWAAPAPASWRNCCLGAVLLCSRLCSLSGLHSLSVMIQTPNSLGHAVKK